MKKYRGCRGFCLFKLGRIQVELWLCPRGENIYPHVHEHIDSTIIVLKGRLWGEIGKRFGTAKKFKSYHIPAGVRHAASMSGYTSVWFINIERWTCDPTSAADDFTTV